MFDQLVLLLGALDRVVVSEHGELFAKGANAVVSGKEAIFAKGSARLADGCFPVRVHSGNSAITSNASV